MKRDIQPPPWKHKIILHILKCLKCTNFRKNASTVANKHPHHSFLIWNFILVLSVSISKLFNRAFINSLIVMIQFMLKLPVCEKSTPSIDKMINYCSSRVQFQKDIVCKVNEYNNFKIIQVHSKREWNCNMYSYVYTTTRLQFWIPCPMIHWSLVDFKWVSKTDILQDARNQYQNSQNIKRWKQQLTPVCKRILHVCN